MIYLDTAALVKLVRRELESDALVDWLDARAVFGEHLTAFVSYDQRLLAAARASGLPVESPSPA